MLFGYYMHIAFTSAITSASSDAISPFKTRGVWRKTRARPGGLHSIWVNFPRGGGQNANTNDRTEESKRLVIVIDVDNTLYSEQDLVSYTGEGIESQIVRNTHLFGLLHFNLTTDQCDALYRNYGSTIEGLRQTLPPNLVEETMSRFYDDVYKAIDFSCLFGMSAKDCMIEGDNKQVRSGYDHGSALQHRWSALAEFLKSVSNQHPVFLASNSPNAHVLRVINSMGLGGVDFAGILTPDIYSKSSKQTEYDSQESIYPTKSSPHQYYKNILKRYPLISSRIILLDDSLHNLKVAESVGIEGIHINQSTRTLEEGISEAIGHILPPETVDAVPSGQSFTFSDIEYLNSKNKIDMNAINPRVWDQLAQQLAFRVQRSAAGVLRIADLGAGMLSMLELIIKGGGADDREKPSMLALINNYLEANQKYDHPTRPLGKLEYNAYESNLRLLHGCKNRLLRIGFQEIQAHAHEGALSFKLPTSSSTFGTEIIIHLHLIDFQGEQRALKDLDLIIGCCFADLFDPGQLALSLQRFALGGSPPLVYLPITFAGITQFDPAYPAAPSLGQVNQMTPSDTTAFRMYSESLANHGHNLDPSLIVNAICNHGGSIISKGSSDWIIDPTLDRHLWETMMYFFGMSGAREMAKRNLDAAGWIKRCREHPRTLVVSNVDLLLHLRAVSHEHNFNDDSVSTGESAQAVQSQEIQFVAPYNVTTVTKWWNTSHIDRLSPDQIEIESICSLISSGTELKIYKGSFDFSSSLDVNIKGKNEHPANGFFCALLTPLR